MNSSVLHSVLFLLFTSMFIFNQGCDKKESPTSPENNQQTVTTLGEVSFNMDLSRQSTGFLDTAGNKLTVTDAAGIKWELEIPGNLLYKRTLVSMTPLKDVASNSDQFRVSCGVIFEPDGFTFVEPAKLTITVPSNITDTYTFYLMSDDGKDLSFAGVKKKGFNAYELSIEHFSGAAGGSPGSIEELCNFAVNSRTYVKNKILELLKTTVNPPHEPPDFFHLCKDQNKNNESLIDSYVDSIGLPENRYITELLNAEHQVNLACEDKGDLEGSLDLSCSLLDRILNRVRTLINNYSTNEKKFEAVVRAALKYTRSYELIGCDNNSSVQTEMLNKLKDYAKNCRDYWYKKLTEEHSLEAIEPLLYFEKKYLFLGGLDEDILDKIEQLLKFELKINMSASVEEIEIEAEALVPLETADIHSVISADGQVNYVKGIIYTSCEGDGDCPSTIMNAGYNTYFKLHFDLCGETPKVIITTPLTYDAIENWNICGDECVYVPQTLERNNSYTHLLTRIPFMMYPNMLWDPNGNVYRFELPLKSDSILAEKEYTYNVEVYSVNVRLELKHKPE